MSDQSIIDPVAYKDLAPFGFPGYRVGDDGSVWSCKNARWGFRSTWKRLKPCICGKGKGHQAVSIYKNKRQTHQYIHILVLLAFVGPRPENLEACHNDGDISNNTPKNLRWDTRSSNVLDAIRHKTVPLGDSHHWGRYTDEQVREVRRLSLDKALVLREIAALVGMSIELVSQIIRGKRRRHVK